MKFIYQVSNIEIFCAYFTLSLSLRILKSQCKEDAKYVMFHELTLIIMNLASYVRNDTASFEELLNPIPSNEIDAKSGITILCNPVSLIAISWLQIHTFRQNGPKIFKHGSVFTE